MLNKLFEGLKILERHFEDNAKVEFHKGYIEAGFNHEIKVKLNLDETEQLKALGWTWSTVDECWVFPAYGSTGAGAKKV